MQRYGTIFTLHLERVLVDRGRILVWTLVALFPPLIIYTYWRSALAANKGIIAGWNLSTISSYYFLLVVASSFLLAHIEEQVSKEDIQEGQLSRYLLKPFPYIFFNFFIETPYRVLQGTFSILIMLGFIFFFGLSLKFSTSILELCIALLIALLGYLLCFTFKMIIGITALWLTDIGGFYQLIDGIMFLFGGFLLPLSLLPHPVMEISYILPFSYMIYFPIVAFQGTQGIIGLLQILLGQALWLTISLLFYSWLYKRGLKKFTGVGQ